MCPASVRPSTPRPHAPPRWRAIAWSRTGSKVSGCARLPDRPAPRPDAEGLVLQGASGACKRGQRAAAHAAVLPGRGTVGVSLKGSWQTHSARGDQRPAHSRGLCGKKARAGSRADDLERGEVPLPALPQAFPRIQKTTDTHTLSFSSPQLMCKACTRLPARSG